jgi:hypothetical protein
MKTYSKVSVGKLLSDTFRIQNGLKQGDDLSPVLFNIASEYAIRKVQENQVALELNGTHQILVYSDDVNLLHDNTNFIKENTETLLEASRDIRIEKMHRRQKYMVMSRHQNSGQIQNIRISNESFQDVAKLKHLATTLRKQGDIHDKTKTKLNSRNACCYSVQNLLSSVSYKKAGVGLGHRRRLLD